MILTASILLAALLPSASVRDIPAEVRTEPPTTCAMANERLVRHPKERIFFRLDGRIVGELGTRFVFRDGSGYAIVIVSCDTPFLRGDIVSLVCTAFQPVPQRCLIAEALEISVTSHEPLPPPTKLSPVEFLSGKHIFQEVSLSGVVTDAFHDEVDPVWDIVIVEADGSKVMVWIPAGEMSDNRLGSLVDASVTVTGVCFPSINGSRRYLRSWLQTASINAVRVTTPASADPFSENAGPDHRQAYRGMVLAVWDERSLFLRTDSDERIEVRLRRGEAVPKPGEHVAVAAFVRNNAFFMRLANALIRRDGGRMREPETPIDITASQILRDTDGRRKISPEMHGKTVKIRGKIIKELPSANSEVQLHIESDGEIVPVWISGGNGGLPAPGAVIEATGVCVITTEADGDHSFYDRLNGFSVVLRDRTDLKVVRPPPWWTPAKFLVVIATLLALLAAILVWNASLRVIAERRGRELLRSSIGRVEAELRTEERTRLAIELHDTIAQSLTGVTFEVNAADRLYGVSPDKARAHLAMADRTLKSCRDELRNCIWDLRGNALGQKDMNDAIVHALTPHIGNATLTVRFDVPRSKLTDNTVHALIRIMRELAINAVRHGHASTIRIAGRRDGDRILISVRDDGDGFDPESAPGFLQGHFGLQGIRERVKRFDGEMRIESSPGNNTRVTISISSKGRTK